MMNIRIIANNLIDSANIMATPTFSSTYPLRYIKLLSRKKSARTADTSDHAIFINWSGEMQSIDSVVVAGHNLTQWATIQCRIYSNASYGGTLLYDSGVVLAVAYQSVGESLGWNDTTFWLTSAVLAGSIRLDINDSYNGDGYFSIRQLFAGLALSPDINISKGAQFSINDNSVLTRSHGKSIHSQTTATYRSVSIELANLRDANFSTWFSELFGAAKRNAVYLSVFPGDSTYKAISHSFIAKLQNDLRFTTPYYQRKRITLDFVEA